MKFFENRKNILLVIWTIHAAVFFYGKNFFPILNYDLFGRIDHFENEKEYFLARTQSGPNFNLDVSNDIAFDRYWKFIVTIKRMMRESPEQLNQAIKERLGEINVSRVDKIVAVRFYTRRGELQKLNFEVTVE